LIDLTVCEENLERNIRAARANNVIIPTFKQMRDPEPYVPDAIREKLRHVGLWEIYPLNLFRITWKNEPIDRGGLYGGPNFIELPK